MLETVSLAVIGGTGLYSMPDLLDVMEYNLDTPFGKPSTSIVVGTLDNRRIAFLARHGRGHTILPGEINFRANFYALKMLGVTHVISVNAVGSLRDDYAPGDLVVPDQVFDFTKDRERSFFGKGLAAHVSPADPFCPELSQLLLTSIQKSDATVHRGGAFIAIEGPRFSTKVESQVFRQWGMSIIGMNAAPEAFLAREAEMCYAAMAHVTDYDVWHVVDAPVSVDLIIRRLAQNVEVSRQALRNLARSFTGERTCSCGSALENTIITNPDWIPPETRQKLELLVGKYLK
jgi:5'-methylthioadenosine phosphorylase